MLLSDFEVWHIVLCNGLIAESEEEDNRQDTYYDSLTSEEQKTYKDKNWERVFDITPQDNHWIKRGSWVQATFWELRKEMIRGVRFFITGKYKHDP